MDAPEGGDEDDDGDGVRYVTADGWRMPREPSAVEMMCAGDPSCATCNCNRS